MDVKQLDRGELIAVVGGILLGISLFLRGLIDTRGSPPGEISVGIGWGAALVGGLLILSGSIWRSRENSTRRKPPGVL